MRKKTKETMFGIVEGQKTVASNIDADKVKKEYLNVLLYQRKQRNNLLGEFFPDGSYKISNTKILEALIVLPKKFDDKNNNIVYASTKIDDVVLNFRIEFDISETYCNANLSIIEIENGVEEDVKHVTNLDSFVDVYSPKFKENVYSRWKVYFDEEVYEKDEYIKNYLLRQKNEFVFNRELTEILSQLYLVRMLKFLDGCGELGEKLKLQYKLMIEKIMQTDSSINQDNTRLKIVLDYVISKIKALPELLKIEEAKTIFLGYSTPIQRIRDKATTPRVTEVAELPKKQEKKEEKKAAPTKSKGKAKGGGGAKFKPFVYDFKNFKSELPGGATVPSFGTALPKASSTANTSKIPTPEPVISEQVTAPMSTPASKTEEEKIQEFLKRFEQRQKKLEISTNSKSAVSSEVLNNEKPSSKVLETNELNKGLE